MQYDTELVVWCSVQVAVFSEVLFGSYAFCLHTWTGPNLLWRWMIISHGMLHAQNSDQSEREYDLYTTSIHWCAAQSVDSSAQSRRLWLVVIGLLAKVCILLSASPVHEGQLPG